MGTDKISVETVIMDWRTLAVVAVVTILWRTVVSLDKEISLLESVCSGVVLIILGWFIFSYLYLLSKRETSWIISNKLAQGIAISVSALNAYVLVYYAMRWHRLMTETEMYVPRDFLLRDVRYAALVLAYCGIIWAAGHLRKMHDNYLLVTEKMPAMRKVSAAESMFRILTDERTVIVILGMVFLWRAVISFDKVGLKVLPFPSGFISWQGKQYRWNAYLPGDFLTASIAIKEYLGIVFYEFAY